MYFSQILPHMTFIIRRTVSQPVVRSCHSTVSRVCVCVCEAEHISFLFSPLSQSTLDHTEFKRCGPFDPYINAKVCTHDLWPARFTSWVCLVCVGTRDGVSLHSFLMLVGYLSTRMRCIFVKTSDHQQTAVIISRESCLCGSAFHDG